MSIKISETTKWHTYQGGQFGVGLVGYRSAKTDPQSVDGSHPFSHKLSEKEDLSDSERAEIEKDCKDLVQLLKKFYYEDDYIDV